MSVQPWDLCSVCSIGAQRFVYKMMLIRRLSRKGSAASSVVEERDRVSSVVPAGAGSSGDGGGYIDNQSECASSIGTDISGNTLLALSDGTGCDANNATPLMLACQQQMNSVVKKLLHRQKDLRTTDATGRTALHYCVDNETTRIAAMLLNRDLGLLDLQDNGGSSALLLAVTAGNQKMVKFLLEHGADVRTRDFQEHTLIHWAAVCGHVSLIDMLVDHGAYVSSTDVHSASPLHYTAQMCGLAVEDDGETKSRSVAVLQRLVAAGSRCGAGRGKDRWSIAGLGGLGVGGVLGGSGSGGTGSVREVQIDCTDQDHRTALFWAASSGSVEACEILIKAGANVNFTDKDGLTALHSAASRGHAPCVEALIKSGALVDAVDNSGCTALFYAVSLGHAECTRTLLQRRAEHSINDHHKRTPAHCAAAHGSVECLKLLRQFNADLWKSNGTGDLPLHEAALAKQNDAVKYLLGLERERINCGNFEGRTCLHIAALTGNLHLLTYLLDHHADKRTVMICENGPPVTPYDSALFKKNLACAELLKLECNSNNNDDQKPSTSCRGPEPTCQTANDEQYDDKLEKIIDTSTDVENQLLLPITSVVDDRGTQTEELGYVTISDITSQVSSDIACQTCTGTHNDMCIQTDGKWTEICETDDSLAAMINNEEPKEEESFLEDDVFRPVDDTPVVEMVTTKSTDDEKSDQKSDQKIKRVEGVCSGTQTEDTDMFSPLERLHETVRDNNITVSKDNFETEKTNDQRKENEMEHDKNGISAVQDVDDDDDDDDVFVSLDDLDSSKRWKRVKHQRWAEQLESIRYIWCDIDSDAGDDCNKLQAGAEPEMVRQRRHSTATGRDQNASRRGGLTDHELRKLRGTGIAGLNASSTQSNKYKVRRRSHSISDARDLPARKRFVKSHLMTHQSDDAVCRTYARVIRKQAILKSPKKNENAKRDPPIADASDHVIKPEESSCRAHVPQQQLDRGISVRELDQRRIYGVRPVAILKPYFSGVTSSGGERRMQNQSSETEYHACLSGTVNHSNGNVSSYCGTALSDFSGLSHHDLSPDLNLLGRRMWSRLLEGKTGRMTKRNLIQEYVRIFETRRHVTMQIQKSIKAQMLDIHAGGGSNSAANESAAVKRLVEEYNGEARTDDKLSTLEFNRLAQYRKHLQDTLLELSGEEKILKKLEKWMRANHIDDLDLQVDLSTFFAAMRVTNQSRLSGTLTSSQSNLTGSVKSRPGSTSQCQQNNRPNGRVVGSSKQQQQTGRPNSQKENSIRINRPKPRVVQRGNEVNTEEHQQRDVQIGSFNQSSLWSVLNLASAAAAVRKVPGSKSGNDVSNCYGSGTEESVIMTATSPPKSNHHARCFLPTIHGTAPITTDSSPANRNNLHQTWPRTTLPLIRKRHISNEKEIIAKQQSLSKVSPITVPKPPIEQRSEMSPGSIRYARVAHVMQDNDHLRLPPITRK